MRKLNIFVTICLFVLFFLHAVFGSLQMFGVNTATISGVLGWITIGLAGAHALIGFYLTVVTLYSIHQSGASYFKENMLFWARRISGLAILILIVFHVLSFYSVNNRLPKFNVFMLVCNILLAVCIFIHVIMNAKPGLIALGIRDLKPYVYDILAVISAILLVSVIAFVFYFVRWNA